jgi:ketosteroid isomerase-like protein
MKPIVRCLFVIAGIFTAEAAFSQDFKSQAAAAASQWDDAFNSGDASKVAQGYTKSAIKARFAAALCGCVQAAELCGL